LTENNFMNTQILYANKITIGVDPNIVMISTTVFNPFDTLHVYCQEHLKSYAGEPKVIFHIL